MIDKSDEKDIVPTVLGKLAALEAMHCQLVWDWAMTQPNPEAALDFHLQALKNKADQNFHLDGLSKEAAESFTNSIERLSNAFEKWLKKPPVHWV